MQIADGGCCQEACRRASFPVHELADVHGQEPMKKRAVLTGEVNFAAARAGVAGEARRRPDRVCASALSRWVALPAGAGAAFVAANGGMFSNIDRVSALSIAAMSASRRLPATSRVMIS